MWLKLTQWDEPPVHGIYFLKAPIYWMVIAGLIVATFIDFEHYIIPNEITVGGIIVGVLLSAVYPPLMGAHTIPVSVVRSGLGVLVGGLTLLVSSLLGGVIGLILVIGSKKGWHSRIPYGPYIALGALLWMFCGNEIMKWYLGFIRG